MLTITHGICFFLSVVLYTTFVHGEESTCTVMPRRNGTYKITCTISTAAFTEGQSFNLYHHTGEKKDRAAVLNYVGVYLCHPFKGYLCQTLPNRTFIITSSSCEPQAEFMFSADGEQPELCTNTTCADHTTQLRRKREASDDGCADGEYSSIPLKLCSKHISQTCRDREICNRLKQNNRNGTDVELQMSIENTNDPLLLTKCNGQPIRPEDKERNSFLINKETSDHI